MVPSLLPLISFPFLVNRRSPTTHTYRFDPDFTKIRCPLCQWRPQKADRWWCAPGCHQRWNTFDTAGICPGCTKQWNETACLVCCGWSAHDDWYESEHKE